MTATFLQAVLLLMSHILKLPTLCLKTLPTNSERLKRPIDFHIERKYIPSYLISLIYTAVAFAYFSHLWVYITTVGIFQ